MITLSNSEQQEIKQMLQMEVECAQLLLSALALEYKALAEHHPATLEAIVQDKQVKIQQLETTSRRREEFLVSLGITFDSINQDGDNSPGYPFNGYRQLSELWEKLVNVAELCRDKNQVNGRIVELVFRQSRDALDILRGVAPDSSALYDNLGKAKTLSNKRSLVHA